MLITNETNSNEATGKLVVGTFLTLDGVMQAPGGPDEDRDGGFDHGGWSINYWDGKMGEIMDGQSAETDALLLGIPGSTLSYRLRRAEAHLAGFYVKNMPFTQLP
ncbi:hypothetical protein BG842_05035 [Haladaptatus sp. W1]|uniref:hypothetical protein n=1 Tax=Haladaptatus sp. W1 TaxID=1897478 RepID=UPI00084978E7|nr:hypothetical protein [Haladaptatus sp. W1]ODR79875.1 hypothetical protein BG842_05035 [Haladaptatus sp. W1]